MRYFPAPMTRLEAAALIGRVRGHFNEFGFGLWALERKDSGAFIGMTGLLNVNFEAPFGPAVEIGWRLARRHWGWVRQRGGVDLPALCFRPIALKEVVSFTTEGNLSQKVMQAIGMQQDLDGSFEHPACPPATPAPHVLYRIDPPMAGHPAWLTGMPSTGPPTNPVSFAGITAP
jgi:hypothetical protein